MIQTFITTLIRNFKSFVMAECESFITLRAIFLRHRQVESQGCFNLLNISHDEYICLAERTAKI